MRKQRLNAASAASGQLETRPKINEVAYEEISSFGFFMAALVKFSLCFGPEKISLSISFNYFQCSENNGVEKVH